MAYRKTFSLPSGTAHVPIDLHDTFESPFPSARAQKGDGNLDLSVGPSDTNPAGVRSLNCGLIRTTLSARCIGCGGDFVVEDFAQLADEVTEEYGAFVTTCPNCHPMAALCFQGDICV